MNLGMACPKGWEALTPLRAPDRATTPLLRNEQTGALEPIDWERALILFCERFKEIKAQHGPESVAFLSHRPDRHRGDGASSARSSNSAWASSTATATRASAWPPRTSPTSNPSASTRRLTPTQDFEESDVLVFVGSNLCIAHPIMWQRVMRNPHRPEIIVIDPRKTETAMAATQHYAAPAEERSRAALRPRAHAASTSGWIDRALHRRPHRPASRTSPRSCSAFTAERVAGRHRPQRRRSWSASPARSREGKRVSFWWTMGVNQGHEATRTAQAIINLALMTGNIGRPGTGANSITGQCNAMGSRIYGNITSLLGGHDCRITTRPRKDRRHARHR